MLKRCDRASLRPRWESTNDNGLVPAVRPDLCLTFDDPDNPSARPLRLVKYAANKRTAQTFAVAHSSYCDGASFWISDGVGGSNCVSTDAAALPAENQRSAT